MTTTYMHVSNKYVFPHLKGITKLLALEDPKEINVAFDKLAVDAQLSTSEFKDELKNDYLKQQQRMKERADQISCVISVLKDDPLINNANEQNDDDADIDDF
ncbi:unnamed protein product [Anisakis simplex]|uniref:EKC/KEOPS complex subunit TPRKB n=1 Tax=Anisakis simplex TaxID=6269 RepID=A0A0M3IYQ8_ANISI|nr:unnamed protein product [Anisakis simplex]